jgi:hypothetical protein
LDYSANTRAAAETLLPNLRAQGYDAALIGSLTTGTPRITLI